MWGAGLPQGGLPHLSPSWKRDIVSPCCRCVRSQNEGDAALTVLLGVAVCVCLAQPWALGRQELACTTRTLPPSLGLAGKSRLWFKPPELALASTRLAPTRTCPLSPREEATVAARPLGPMAGPGAEAES